MWRHLVNTRSVPSNGYQNKPSVCNTMAVTLESLSQLINNLNANMDSNMKAIREEVAGFNTKLTTVEGNVDEKIENLRKSMEEKIESLKVDLRKEVKQDFNAEMDSVKNDVGAIRAELDRAKEDIEKMSEMLKVPFHQDRSVVVYGLPPEDELDDDELAEWLFEEVLGLTVKPCNVSRTKPRNEGQCGVLKIELDTTEDKIEVLRAKRKCEEYENLDQVIIKSCKGHIERVNRLNLKWILSQFKNGDKYTITSHGLIKPKGDKKLDADSEGGAGSDVAANGGQGSNGTATAKVSDKGGPRGEARADGQQKQPDSSRPTLSRIRNDTKDASANQKAAAKSPDRPNEATRKKPKSSPPPKRTQPPRMKSRT